MSLSNVESEGVDATLSRTLPLEAIVRRPRRRKESDVECTYCGDELDDEEAASPKKDADGDVMCDDCWREKHEPGWLKASPAERRLTDVLERS